MTDVGTIRGSIALDDKWTPNIGKAGNATKAFKVGVAAAGAAVVATAAILAKAALDALKFADAMDNQARATNAGVESLQVLNTAAELAGQSSQSITTAMQRLQRSLVEGTEQTDEAFQKLGLSANELKRIAPEEQFKIIMQRLGEMENPTERAATSMILLGRSGANLQALSGDALPKLEARMRSLGLVIDKETIASMDKMEEQTQFLTRTAGAAWTNLGAGITSSKTLGVTLDALTDAIGAVNVWLQNNRDEIGSWVTAGILVGAKALEVTITLTAAFVKGLGMLGKVVVVVEQVMLDWFRLLVDSPLAKMIPGVQGLRETILGYVETIGAGIDSQLQFFDGVESAGETIDRAAVSVSDFQSNLLNQMQQGEQNIEQNQRLAESLTPVNNAVQTSMDKTSFLTALLDEWKRKDEEVLLATQNMGAGIIEEFERTVDGMEIFNSAVEGVGDLTHAQSQRVNEAFREMGIVTQTELDATAKRAVENYEVILNSGVATAEEIAEAEMKMQEAVRTSAGETKEFRLTAYEALTSGTIQTLGVLGQQHKTAAIAGAIISTYMAIAKALASAPWPFNLVLAAGAAAAGWANVSRIRSSKPGFERGTARGDFQNFGVATDVTLHGTEAVIPEGTGHQLANEIARAMPGGPTYVTLQVDGTTFARWVEDASKRGALRIHSSAVRTF